MTVTNCHKRGQFHAWQKAEHGYVCGHCHATWPRQQGSNDGQSDTSLADGPSTLPESSIGAEGSL